MNGFSVRYTKKRRSGRNRKLYYTTRSQVARQTLEEVAVTSTNCASCRRNPQASFERFEVLGAFSYARDNFGVFTRLLFI